MYNYCNASFILTSHVISFVICQQFLYEHKNTRKSTPLVLNLIQVLLHQFIKLQSTSVYYKDGYFHECPQKRNIEITHVENSLLCLNKIGRQKFGGCQLMQRLWYQLLGLASSVDQILFQQFIDLVLASISLLTLESEMRRGFQLLSHGKAS